MGWPLNVSVLPQELETMIGRVDGVRLVKRLILGTEGADDVPEVTIEELMLPRLVGVEVVEGEPVPLDQLRQAPDVLPDGEWTPIPILPERC